MKIEHKTLSVICPVPSSRKEPGFFLLSRWHTMMQSVSFTVIIEEQCCSNKMKDDKYSRCPCQENHYVLLVHAYL